MSGSKHAHLLPAGLQASLPYLLVYLCLFHQKLFVRAVGLTQSCPLLTQFFTEEQNDPDPGD